MQNHLSTTVALAALFVCCVCGSVQAQSTNANAKAVPKIDGNYVLTDIEVCNPGKTGPVIISGLATFNSATGKLKLVGSVAGGDPMTLDPLKQTLSYSNSATTVTLGDTVYQAIYGKLANGIATYFSLIAAADPCAAQATLSRQ